MKLAQLTFFTRKLWWTTVLCLTLSFLLSRLIFWFMGVRYDSSSLSWFWQYLDIEVLKNRLLPGLLHLHSQPPGFNLFLGVILKLFPNSPLLCFNVIYVALGFVLYCSLYYLLRLVRLSRFVALLCAFCFIVSPNSILYENWLFYTYPLAVLLVLAAVALRRFQDDTQPFYAGIFFLLVAIICLSRSVFHLAFFLPCVVLVLIPRGNQRRKITLFACAALCVISTLYIKNFYMFGFFGGSSLKGMSMAKVAAASIGHDRINRLVKSGSISSIFYLSPFLHLNQYPEELRRHALPLNCLNVPELTAERKASGSPNFNHRDYITISQEYEKGAIFIIRHYPRLYLFKVCHSWLVYLKPSWQNVFLEKNVNAIRNYISFLSLFRLRYWIDLRTLVRIPSGITGKNFMYPVTNFLLLPPIFFMVFILGIFRMCRLFITGETSHLAYLFMIYAVMYIAVVGNMIEIGENNRFRVMTDPLVFVLVVATLRDVCVYTMVMWRKFKRVS